jgi:hypothetical protein
VGLALGGSRPGGPSDCPIGRRAAVAPFRVAGLVVLFAASLSGCASLPTREELVSLPGPQLATAVEGPARDGRARFRDIFCGVLARGRPAGGEEQDCADWLWRLDDEPRTPPRPLPAPDRSRQVYLVTGAFSECLGDEARPFNSAATALAETGFRISMITVSGRSGSEYNAARIAARLSDPPPGEEGPVVLIGYSKGANDILEFLVRFPEVAARVESVVSVAGAIAGSPLAGHAGPAYDRFFAQIPSNRCAPGDGGVLKSLRPGTRRAWLADNALPGHVQYFSVAAFATRARVAGALLAPWKLLLQHDLRNDGQLLARDQLIPGSTLLGYVHADHWSAAIDVEVVHPLLGTRPDPAPFPRAALLEAMLLQLAESRPAP